MSVSKIYEYKPGSILNLEPEILDVQRKLNILRPYYNNVWGYLSEDGKYGKNTSTVVSIYQQKCWYGVILSGRSGQLGPTTAQYIDKDYNFRTRQSISSLPVPPKDRLNARNYSFHNMVEFSVKQMQIITDFVNVLYNECTMQLPDLNNIVDYVNNNKKLGGRRLQQCINDANNILRDLQIRGLTTVDFFRANGKINRQSVLDFMNSVVEAVGRNKWVVSSQNLMHALRPIIDFLNRIPGLKYFGAIEKLVIGFRFMFEGRFEEAFGYFLDAIREILESLIVDAVVVAAIASGAIVFAIIVVIVFFVIDYFFFSENSGESLVDRWTGNKVTTNRVREQWAPTMYHFVNK